MISFRLKKKVSMVEVSQVYKIKDVTSNDLRVLKKEFLSVRGVEFAHGNVMIH